MEGLGLEGQRTHGHALCFSLSLAVSSRVWKGGGLEPDSFPECTSTASLKKGFQAAKKDAGFQRWMEETGTLRGLGFRVRWDEIQGQRASDRGFLASGIFSRVLPCSLITSGHAGEGNTQATLLFLFYLNFSKDLFVPD